MQRPAYKLCHVPPHDRLQRGRRRAAVVTDMYARSTQVTTQYTQTRWSTWYDFAAPGQTMLNSQVPVTYNTTYIPLFLFDCS